MRTVAAASCFNRTCRIYAPVYRQASVLTFAHTGGIKEGENLPTSRHPIFRPAEAIQAFELAYSDVRRAFIHFVDDPANWDRPFILAGHSQGSLLLTRLLAGGSRDAS